MTSKEYKIVKVNKGTVRAVPSTRRARAYSCSIKLELYFWARVLEKKFANAKQQNKSTKLLPKRLSPLRRLI